MVDTLESLPKENITSEDDCVSYLIYSDKDMYISILEQDLITSLPVQNEYHYDEDAAVKHLAASMCEEEDERILTKLNELASKPTLVEVDDPAHWSLPAGWSKDHKPIFMKDFYSTVDFYGVPRLILPISELTENEKFALTLARISKRPRYSFTFGSRTWDQSESRYALKTRTWYSYDMVEREMEQLQKIFDDYIKEHGEAEEV